MITWRINRYGSQYGSAYGSDGYGTGGYSSGGSGATASYGSASAQNPYAQQTAGYQSTASDQYPGYSTPSQQSLYCNCILCTDWHSFKFDSLWIWISKMIQENKI